MGGCVLLVNVQVRLTELNALHLARSKCKIKTQWNWLVVLVALQLCFAVI